MKVAILGSRRMVTGLLLGGIHMGYICENAQESQAHLEACMKNPDIGIILVSNTVASMIPEQIHRIKMSPNLVPIISVIPESG